MWGAGKVSRTKVRGFRCRAKVPGDVSSAGVRGDDVT